MVLAVLAVMIGMTYSQPTVKAGWLGDFFNNLLNLTEWVQTILTGESNAFIAQDVPSDGYIQSSVTFSSGTTFEGGLIVNLPYELELSVAHTRTDWYLQDDWLVSYELDGSGTWVEIDSGEILNLAEGEVISETLSFTPPTAGSYKFKLTINNVDYTDELINLYVNVNDMTYEDGQGSPFMEIKSIVYTPTDPTLLDAGDTVAFVVSVGQPVGRGLSISNMEYHFELRLTDGTVIDSTTGVTLNGGWGNVEGDVEVLSSESFTIADIGDYTIVLVVDSF